MVTQGKEVKEETHYTEKVYSVPLPAYRDNVEHDKVCLLCDILSAQFQSHSDNRRSEDFGSIMLWIFGIQEEEKRDWIWPVH